ncbi:flagellar protein FlaG [Sulfurospirillum barnesii]|uniref:Flagellar protein FlaG n=1 Tax=Sulfurospirillum barnesii (strain ATCC 700032 / DSM 10660 / SES-3) TaxID=760154 RepID=I3XWT7_SULBS|nr:flagellar protein FlaG [Sulfurospirillum barnesii]AFL68411.1 flagellar protein FlaG [Sulfurospirillum barnesii SES-3]
MDVFSATSKQVGTTVAPKVSETASVREVDKVDEVSKTAPEEEKESKNTLTKTVSDLNQQMDRLETNIAFGFNDELSMLYVSVMEKSTGKTIRKIPTEEAMALSAKMKEIVGIIFDKKG